MHQFLLQNMSVDIFMYVCLTISMKANSKGSKLCDLLLNLQRIQYSPSKSQSCLKCIFYLLLRIQTSDIHFSSDYRLFIWLCAGGMARSVCLLTKHCQYLYSVKSYYCYSATSLVASVGANCQCYISLAVQCHLLCSVKSKSSTCSCSHLSMTTICASSSCSELTVKHCTLKLAPALDCQLSSFLSLKHLLATDFILS